MGEYEKMMMMINKGKEIVVRTRANHNYSAEDEDDDNITSPHPPPKSVLAVLPPNTTSSSSQSDLEANLFKLMEWRGYGEEYINRYKMMTRFHHQRVPLVILVCGTACVGKSTIATQLAQRLNLPNVLKTDMVCELIRTSTDAPLSSTPVWARDFGSSEELITKFCLECRIVRKGIFVIGFVLCFLAPRVEWGSKKGNERWKANYNRGNTFGPKHYLMDDEHKTPIAVSEGNRSITLFVASDDNSAVQMENNSQVNKVSESLESIVLATASDNKGETVKTPEVNGSTARKEKSGPELCETVKTPEVNGSTARKEKSGPEPIIIPIVLKMAEFDHKALLEERITTQTGKCLIQDTDSLITNLKTIQDYLCSFKSRGLTVVNVSATTFPQTVDWLHGYLLQGVYWIMDFLLVEDQPLHKQVAFSIFLDQHILMCYTLLDNAFSSALNEAFHPNENARQPAEK
ncbi:hypothetical protein CRYUN_Cryun19dG0002400 [Craigia yunnanensis]